MGIDIKTMGRWGVNSRDKQQMMLGGGWEKIYKNRGWGMGCQTIYKDKTNYFIRNIINFIKSPYMYIINSDSIERKL